MAIALVQKTPNTVAPEEGAGSSLTTDNFASPVTVGNIVIETCLDIGSLNTEIFSDSGSGTHYVDYRANNFICGHLYPAGASAINCTVSNLQFTAGYFGVAEFSGVKTGLTDDSGSSYNTGFGSNIDSGNVSVTGNHLYIGIAFFGGSGITPTLGDGWTQLYASNGMIIAYKISSGTQSFNLTLSGERSWGAICVAYEEAKWTYINYCKAYNIAGGMSLNGDAVLNIQEGDLLVAICEWYEDNANPVVTISDGGSNNLTILTQQVVYAAPVYYAFAYKIAASANASAQFALNFDKNESYRTLMILQFRPSSGTVSLDVYDTTCAGGSSTAVLSDNITTTGDSELVIGGHGIYGDGQQTSISNTQIGDVSSEGCPYSAIYYCHLWYKVFTSIQSNIHAQGTLGASVPWNAGILSFKLSGGSGAGSMNVWLYRM